MKSFVSLIWGLFLSSFLLAQEFDTPVVNPYSLDDDGVRSSPTLADLDNDGDLDLLSGLQSGDYGLFDNIGSDDAPLFGDFLLEPFSLGPIGGDATPFFIDLDDDGDYDVVSGGDGGIRYFENLGNSIVASFTIETQNPWDISSPTGISKPYFVDIDDDGDPDLFSGSTDGNIYYYENTGSLGNPEFDEAETNPFGFMDLGVRSAPSFADLDDDGDYDALVGVKNSSIFYFENIGNSELAEFDSIGTFQLGISSVGQDPKPFFIDFDSDGDQDLFIGNTYGEYYYFENISTALNVNETKFSSFLIYPNPALDKLIIKNGDNKKIDEVSIYNQYGQLVLKSNQPSLVLDISHLDKGLYIIEITKANDSSSMKLVVE